MESTKTSSVHQFTVKDVRHQDIPLSRYAGKVLLIVNTASQCGFTPQLADMEELYTEFKDEGFEILAFPSNDFNGQEPLEGEALEQFCMREYQAAYPIFDKVHVKGRDAHDLFIHLSDKLHNGRSSSSPKWNFHKYLVDKQGRVRDYYYSLTRPNAGRVKKAIRKLLDE